MKMLSDGRSFVAEYLQPQVYADKPEPPRTPATYLTREEILRQFKWTEEEFSTALSFNFPTAARRTGAPGTFTLTLVWNAGAVASWRDKTRATAKAMLALVK